MRPNCGYVECGLEAFGLACSCEYVGKNGVTMAMRPATAYECPGCGIAVEPGEEFVVAREYQVVGDFSLHCDIHDLPVRAERRFHVEHFRRQIGDKVYELLDQQPAP